MRAIALAATAAALVAALGCKSDEAKLEDLELEAASARLELLAAEQALDRCGSCAERDSLLHQREEARRERDLAERDLARFLR